MVSLRRVRDGLIALNRQLVRRLQASSCAAVIRRCGCWDASGERYDMADVVEDMDWEEDDALLDEPKFTIGSVLSD
jgi:hypothetical protein